MVQWLVILLGVGFVLIFIRILPRLVYELAFFGAIFGVVEWWKYWGVAVLDLPHMPESVYIFTASFMATWIIVRLLYIANLFFPVLKPVNLLISGK